VQREVWVGATALGIQPGGIQGGSFLKKNVEKWLKIREKVVRNQKNLLKEL